jgi:mannose-6-phosphate isomerase-like protein (cupin superfamily)
MNPRKTQYASIAAFVTKDGSLIRELMHPAVHGNRNQSLAEATLPPGTTTLLHRHLRSEAIYYFACGTGMMTLGSEVFAVAAGDTINIAPGTPHRVQNTGDEPMKILCACAPAYSHEDTVVVRSEG